MIRCNGNEAPVGTSSQRLLVETKIMVVERGSAVVLFGACSEAKRLSHNAHLKRD
jgi:hypothetical protein